MQIESCRCNSVPFQDAVREPRVCIMKTKRAYPQLRACKGSSLPKGSGTHSSECGGGCRLACLPVWSLLLLSPVGRLPCLVCGPFFCAFSKIPLLGPISWSGQSGPSLSCGVIHMASVSLYLHSFPWGSYFLFWTSLLTLEHTVVLLCMRLPGPATCLHSSSTQEVFSERWPLVVMRQCWEDDPGGTGGCSGSVCFAVRDKMVLASCGELHDPRELWRKGHCSVLPFPDFQTTTLLCTVLL